MNNELKWNENEIHLDWIILTNMTFTYKFDGKDIYTDHLHHLRYINPLSLVELFHLQVGQNSRKLNFPELPRNAQLDLILTSMTLTLDLNGNDMWLYALLYPIYINPESFVEIFHL